MNGAILRRIDDLIKSIKSRARAKVTYKNGESRYLPIDDIIPLIANEEITKIEGKAGEDTGQLLFLLQDLLEKGEK